MEDIQDRLKTATDDVLKHYAAWFDAQKDAGTRADLQESIHELRKAVSRAEIDIALSERGEGVQKPLPIPSHKSFSKDNTESILGGNGNDNGGEGNGGPKPARKNSGPRQSKPRGKRPSHQKES
jgi:hypothetical protein